MVAEDACEGPDERAHQRAGYLVIGSTTLSRRICQELASDTDSDAGPVDHLVAPADDCLAAAVLRRPVAVAVVVHDDVLAVRYALATAHLDPTVRVLVTIFDRTIADHVATLLPQAVVTSPAGIAAPSLAGPCLGRDVVAAWAADGLDHRVVQAGNDRVHQAAPGGARGPGRFRLGQMVLGLGVQDLSARLMVGGLLGLLTVLAVDFAWLMLAGHHTIPDAFLEAARVVATVGPGPTEASAAYATFSAVAMLCCVGFTALFTAGLVDRLLEPRLVSLLGSRSAPRRDHVIVVGMGQVGIRLCTELRRLGVPVVGVERDLAAPQLHVARALRIPVVAGHGGDREVLERVGLRRALALAAVGSDENDNIAVAIAAHAIAPGTRVVLRAGEQEAIAETRSLLPLGVTRDVWSLAAARIVDVLRHGREADHLASLLGAAPADADGLDDQRPSCRHAVLS